MQFSRLLIVCLGLLGADAAMASRASVSPVTKVVHLLSDLEAKLMKDAQEEKTAFDAYMDWCANGAKDKEYEIKTAKREIEGLTATISKADADLETFSSKVETLGSSISANEADLKAAKAIREKENSEFVATEKELVDVVDTLERAINVLERKLRGSAMLQAKVDTQDVQNMIHAMGAVLDAASLATHDRQKLLGLLQHTSDDEEDDGYGDVAPGAPAAEVYKSHSESIIDVLQDLKEKGMAQLEELRREETNARHNFELLKQSLESQISVDSKGLDESKQMKLAAAETKAGAEGDLQVTQKSLEEAEHVLKNMDSDCATKQADHEASVKNRQEELEAVAAAMKAIQDMTAGASNLVYNDTAVFLQLAGSAGSVGAGSEGLSSHLRTVADLAHFEVYDMVRKLARAHKSAQLMELAGRISAVMQAGSNSGEDPFAKVKAMISEMIERLLKEAGEEAQHKAYCDQEMGETKKKLDELKYDIEKLSSKLDKATARSAELKDEVAVLQGEIADIVSEQAKADVLRQEEHKVYVQSKADLEQGLQGVRLALKILRDYYASEGEAGSAGALLQQPEAPEVHEKATGTGTSVIGLLEVVESDMGKSLASTEMNEESAAVAYQRLSMDNKVSKAMKEKDVQYKTKEATSLDKSAKELSSDRDSTQSRLDAELAYSTTIRGMCELEPETYEERVARREEEISGLKEALRILEGESVFLQRRQRPHRHLALRGAVAPHAAL